jgi:putative nucleotidyltransferase with HDIG domain
MSVMGRHDREDGPRGEQASPMQERLRKLLAQAAETCDLPPLPRAAVRAISLTREPDTSIQDLVRVVGGDGAFAAQVLRVARSATYLGRREPPRTLHQAITTIGFETVRQILVVASARSVYLQGDDVAERLWNHALATALAADVLATQAGEPRGGPAFIAGLLHDVGKLVFHLADADAFAGVDPRDKGGEQRKFGVSHAVAGGALVERWGLESAVVSAVVEHHVRPIHAGLPGRVAIADWIAHQIGQGSTERDTGRLQLATRPPADLLAVAERVATAFQTERAYFE